MAVRLTPCFRCPLREGCELRDDWRRKVAGLGLTSAAFDCPKLSAELRPGRRIEISVPVVYNYLNEEGYSMGRKDVAATITYVDPKGRFTCTVDPGQIDESMCPDGMDINKIRFRRKMRHIRIRRFLLGPDWPICEFSHRVLRDGWCDGADDNCCRRAAPQSVPADSEDAFVF
jgi:hypothetical protein